MRLNNRDALFREAVEHHLGGRFKEALPLYDAVIRLDPNLAAAHCNRAIALQSVGRLAEALRDYDRAIALLPNYADAYYNKAIVLKRLDRIADAVQCYDRAIALKPDHTAALTNRGNALRELDRPAEALENFERVLAFSPELADAHLNRANALADLKRLQEALRSFDKAIALEPNYVEALYGKSTCTLLSGDWPAGWPLYEWRKDWAMSAGLHIYCNKEWRGDESLDGKTLVIHAEQGLGDTIQFCRYALLAQRKGARVILAVQESLVRLLESLGSSVEIEKQPIAPASFDHHISLLSMPLAFGTTLGTCPAEVPYLRAEPERIAKWLARIGTKGFKIGICWQGRKQSLIDLGRSFSLRYFEEISQLPNVRLISLQKNEGVEQLENLPAGMTVEMLGEEFDAGMDAFIDTAAVMECLDLVITSDTAIAHLAGALGRPAWVALKYVPDWRWLLDRADSPWYPTLKLFRQPAPGDWASVFAAMRASLAAQVGNRPNAAPPVDDVNVLLAAAADYYSHDRLADALTLYDAIIRRTPDAAIAHCNRGLVLQSLQRMDDAITSYERAIRLEPNLAEAHYNRGNALRDAGRTAEALASYDRALLLNPSLQQAHFNKANLLQDLERFEEAVESFDRAIAIETTDAQAYNNRSNALQQLNRSDAALRSSDVAIMLRPDFAVAHNNRGNILRDMRRLDEAYQSYDRAIELNRDLVDALWNKATCALLMGNFEEGWRLYESRKRKFAESRFDNYSQPVCSGKESLEGKTLFIYAEQGLGDTIQFCRYAPLARQRGARVILAVQDKLTRLLKDIDPDIEIVPQQHTPALFDYHAALMSMPLALGGPLPATVPYLHAEAKRVAMWKNRLGGEGFKIGICWQGNKKSGTDAGKSFHPRHFDVLSRLSGIRLISLQKNDGVEQLGDLPADMKIETLGEEFDSGPDAFLDTAAVMECLDLVITSDTAVAHLAGALGRTVWVALKYVPDWRWLLDRADSPWYPTMRLFRQSAPGDWASVFVAIQAQLMAENSPRLSSATSTESLFGRALAHQRCGRPAEALALYDGALRENPNFAAAYYNRGLVLHTMGKVEDALWNYDNAISLQPNSVEVHYNRGIALKALGRLEEALRSYDHAIEVNPQYANAHNNRGNLLSELRRPEEALCSLNMAVALNPEFAEAYNNRGRVLHDLNRMSEALDSIHRAIELKPTYAEAYNNLGNALKSLGRPREALPIYDKAIALKPNFAEAIYAKGTCTLLSGDWKAGWPLYEWRKKWATSARLQSYPSFEWTGQENLEGKTLYIQAEQGLGDTIQFCRYALRAQKRGAKVIIGVEDRLIRLIESLGPEIAVIPSTSVPKTFDYPIALMSMPLAFDTTPANCPAHVPYLHAEPERVAMWKARLGDEGVKIGICWQGNKQNAIDLGRSFSVHRFEGISRLASVRLISLQKNDGTEQLERLPSGMSVETLGEEFDSGPDAFLDTAAVMECLDLVITSDTAVAHLAGALGRTVWVALKYVPDWRWLLDRADSPWYPTMRLFRQSAPGDWSSVFAAIQTQLAEYMKGPAGNAP